VHKDLEYLRQLLVQREAEYDGINTSLKELAVQEGVARDELEGLKVPLQQHQVRKEQIREQKKFNDEKIFGFQLIQSQLRQGKEPQGHEMSPVGSPFPPTTPNDRLKGPLKRKDMEPSKPTECCDLTESDKEKPKVPRVEKKQRRDTNSKEKHVHLPPTYSYPLSDAAIKVRLQPLLFINPPPQVRADKVLSIEDYKNFASWYLKGESNRDIQSTMSIKKRRFHNIVEMLGNYGIIRKEDQEARKKYLCSKGNVCSLQAD
jgi:hypothetical protein